MSIGRSLPPKGRSTLQLIDEAATRFEAEWKHGGRPSLSQFLEEAPAEIRAALFLELAQIDLHYACRTTRPVSITDYSREFPGFVDAGCRAELEAALEQARMTIDHPTPAKVEAAVVPPTIGKYQVLHLLGTGGQAETYLAYHPNLGQVAVLKLARSARPAERAPRDQIIREGRILAGLRHPNLVRVFDLDFDGDRPYLVVEYVSGRTLEAFVRDERPDWRRAVQLVAEVARAAALAHREGVTHQDITPRNVLIDASGVSRLIDFGLARWSAIWDGPGADLGSIGGTPVHAAPEQFKSDPAAVGPWTDIFGLGGLLYFLLTGRPPYQGSTLQQVLVLAEKGRYDAGPLDDCTAPARVKAICRRALAARPADRFRSADEMAEALDAAARPRRWAWPAAGAGLFLLCLIVGWLAGKREAEAPQRESTDGLHLEVRAWDGAEYRPVAEQAPLPGGTRVQIRCRVPAQTGVALFGANGRGELSLLRSAPPEKNGTELVFPGNDQAAPLLGPSGTELVFICGQPGGNVVESDVRRAWAGDHDWPPISGGRVFRVRPTGVVAVGQQNRDFGLAENLPEPDMAVRRRLDSLRSGLAAYPQLEGIAFRHE